MSCIFQDWLKEWPIHFLWLKMIQENTHRLPNWLMLWLSKWLTLQIEWLTVLLIGRSIHGLIVAFWWWRDSLNHFKKGKQMMMILFCNQRWVDTRHVTHRLLCGWNKGCGYTLMMIVLSQLQNTIPHFCVRTLSWNHSGISLKTTSHLSVHTMHAQSTQSQSMQLMTHSHVWHARRWRWAFAMSALHYLSVEHCDWSTTWPNHNKWCQFCTHNICCIAHHVWCQACHHVLSLTFILGHNSALGRHYLGLSVQ